MADSRQMPALDMHQKLRALRQARGWSIRDMVPILKSADPQEEAKPLTLSCVMSFLPNIPNLLTVLEK